MYDHILIPVAPGHHGEYSQAIDVTRKLLNPGGKVSVLAVLEEIPGYYGTYIPEDQMEKNKGQVSGELKNAFKNEEVMTRVIFGHSANSILDWAERKGVDCIVVTSHRPGLSDYFIGSTAARIVRHAKCPVFVLR